MNQVLDRFFERARHENAEDGPTEWLEAGGVAYRNILGDPAAQAPPIPAMMIPQGMVGQVPMAQTGPGQPGPAMQMMPVQMIQRGFFQQPQMGGASGQMVPVAFPQQMQVVPSGMPPGGPQRSGGAGGGFAQAQGQGGPQHGPRGKGQDHPGPGNGPGAMQMAFVPQGSQGYPQAFMIPAGEQLSDLEQY